MRRKNEKRNKKKWKLKNKHNNLKWKVILHKNEWNINWGMAKMKTTLHDIIAPARLLTVHRAYTSHLCVWVFILISVVIEPVENYKQFNLNIWLFENTCWPTSYLVFDPQHINQYAVVNFIEYYMELIHFSFEYFSVSYQNFTFFFSFVRFVASKIFSFKAVYRLPCSQISFFPFEIKYEKSVNQAKSICKLFYAIKIN